MALNLDDHLGVVLGELHGVCDKFYDIGLALRVSPTTLDAIKKENKELKACLRETIREWLKSTTTSPTWQFLIDALKGTIVGEPKLAEKLKKEKVPEADPSEQKAGATEVDGSVQPDPADPPDRGQPQLEEAKRRVSQQWFPKAQRVPIPKKCNVLVLGRRGSGKSTVANHILGEGVFQSSKETSAKKHNDAQEEGGDTYDIQIVDTCGLFDDVGAIRTHVKNKLDSLSLVIFVTTSDNLTPEEEKAFKFFTTQYKQSSISQISALVITRCEGIREDERSELNRKFTTDSATDSIAQFMIKGIYRVGLPDLNKVQEDIKPTYEAVAEADTIDLRRMMFKSTKTYPFDDVFPKLPWLYPHPYIKKGIQVFAMIMVFIIIAPFYHRILAYFW